MSKLQGSKGQDKLTQGLYVFSAGLWPEGPRELSPGFTLGTSLVRSCPVGAPGSCSLMSRSGVAEVR
jgi:hypothetical protein